jgi:hypothetical protein
MILSLCRWKVTKPKHLFKRVIIHLIPNHYLWLRYFRYHWCLNDWFYLTLWGWCLFKMPFLTGIRPWGRISVASPSFFLFISDHLLSSWGFLIAWSWSLVILLSVSLCTYISLFVSPSFIRGITALGRWSVPVFVLFVSFFTLTAIRPSMMFTHVILFIIIWWTWYKLRNLEEDIMVSISFKI